MNQDIIWRMNLASVMKILFYVRRQKKTPFGQFMCFESLTMVPFDLDGVDTEQMSDRERKLLKRISQKSLCYHSTISR